MTFEITTVHYDFRKRMSWHLSSSRIERDEEIGGWRVLWWGFRWQVEIEFSHRIGKRRAEYGW